MTSYYLTGEGFSRPAGYSNKSRKRKYVNPRLSCFSSSDFDFELSLISQIYGLYPQCELKPKKEWPTGVTVRDAFFKLIRTKIETNIISKNDAKIVLDSIPLFVDGIRSDPKFKNRR